MADSLIKDAQSFLRKLEKNNRRPWWEENKATYVEKLKEPALALLENLSPKLQELAGDPVKTKLFRPHRDVRFSKDKTPYTTHLHMMWQIEAGGRANPAFFFGINTTRAFVGAGMMGFDKDLLEDWRKMVDLDGDRIGSLVAGLQSEGFTHWQEPELKRVPKPWTADHPLADLLRRKSLVMSAPLPPDRPLKDALITIFARATPLNKMLGGIAFG